MSDCVKDMKKIHEEYEQKHNQRHDKRVAAWLKKIEDEIRIEVSRGITHVSLKGFECACTPRYIDNKEYHTVEAIVGYSSATIKWSLTSIMKTCLENLTAAAKSEGIILSAFSYELVELSSDGNWYPGPVNVPYGECKIKINRKYFRGYLNLDRYAVRILCNVDFSLD